MPTRASYREKIWDHAAGTLIVSEAGGVVTDILGRPLDFHHGRELPANRGVAVSNGHLHTRLGASHRCRAPRLTHFFTNAFASEFPALRDWLKFGRRSALVTSLQ